MATHPDPLSGSIGVFYSLDCNSERFPRNEFPKSSKSSFRPEKGSSGNPQPGLKVTIRTSGWSSTVEQERSKAHPSTDS